MSWDDPERLRSRPPLDIPDHRVERVLDAVLAGLDRRPPSPSPWVRLSDWLTALSPQPRYAMPMMAALVLGVMVSQGLQTTESPAQLSDLLAYSSPLVTGF
ncbi:hypothetical protein A6A04_00900 [Paramagnetospirillum marisnigri]|uniref:Uncharacterized protein n=1 Tax=Paramagnetospirillum marisnigri TaxID=1285242 RepID=A0A178MU48_9PROT|nr:hypothetical protein [Paramagnetospirillum marisnigri]OAN52284.1 hypothetical protein A6A04_00900 [Paramagnetospirillum marisnigri]